MTIIIQIAADRADLRRIWRATPGAETGRVVVGVSNSGGVGLGWEKIDEVGRTLYADSAEPIEFRVHKSDRVQLPTLAVLGALDRLHRRIIAAGGQGLIDPCGLLGAQTSRIKTPSEGWSDKRNPVRPGRSKSPAGIGAQFKTRNSGLQADALLR